MSSFLRLWLLFMLWRPLPLWKPLSLCRLLPLYWRFKLLFTGAWRSLSRNAGAKLLLRWLLEFEFSPLFPLRQVQPPLLLGAAWIATANTNIKVNTKKKFMLNWWWYNWMWWIDYEKFVLLYKKISINIYSPPKLFIFCLYLYKYKKNDIYYFLLAEIFFLLKKINSLWACCQKHVKMINAEFNLWPSAVVK